LLGVFYLIYATSVFLISFRAFTLLVVRQESHLPALIMQKVLLWGTKPNFA